MVAPPHCHAKSLHRVLRSLPNCLLGSGLGGILRRVGWRVWRKAWGFLEAPVEAMGLRKTSPKSHCLPQRLSRVLGREA